MPDDLSLGTWRRDPDTVVRRAGRDLDAGARARSEAVVFDVLAPSERPFALELPGDPRIDPIAEALLADPSDDRGLQEWAAHLGLSDRTIAAFRRVLKTTPGSMSGIPYHLS